MSEDNGLVEMVRSWIRAGAREPEQSTVEAIDTLCQEALARQSTDLDQWQDIETAPRDGTAVLLFGGDGCFGWAPPANMGPVSICYWNDVRWIEATGEQYQPHEGATHWRPLPAPPQPQGGGE